MHPVTGKPAPIVPRPSHCPTCEDGDEDILAGSVMSTVGRTRVECELSFCPPTASACPSARAACVHDRESAHARQRLLARSTFPFPVVRANTCDRVRITSCPKGFEHFERRYLCLSYSTYKVRTNVFQYYCTAQVAPSRVENARETAKLTKLEEGILFSLKRGNFSQIKFAHRSLVLHWQKSINNNIYVQLDILA